MADPAAMQQLAAALTPQAPRYQVGGAMGDLDGSYGGPGSFGQPLPPPPPLTSATDALAALPGKFWGALTDVSRAGLSAQDNLLAGQSPEGKSFADMPLVAAPGQDSRLNELAHYLSQGMIGGGPGTVTSGIRTPIRAYHGSPYSFDKFDLSKVGTGEGAQAYGHGLYFAEQERVAQAYRNNLSQPQISNRWFSKALNPDDLSGVARQVLGENNGDIAGTIKQMGLYKGLPGFSDDMAALHAAIGKNYKPTGSMYEVNLHADPAALLDWDKPLAQQSPQVRSKVLDLSVPDKPHVAGEQAYYDLAGQYMTNRGVIGLNAEHSARINAAERLNQSGIPGIKYLDGGSRGAGTGTSNYVMFDPAKIEILRKYGLLAGLLGGGAAAEANAGEAK